MRVIVAGRLSRKVADRDQTGLDSQEREAVRWAESEGHEVVAVLADFKSGRSGLEARKNLRPWVTDPARLARYDAIVALKVDRLTRGDRAETAKLEQWARDHGKVLLIAAAGGVQFPSEGTAGIQWDLMLRMAHEEWLAISERYTRMQRTLRDKGSALGMPAWGFTIASQGGIKVFVPTNEARAYVPQMFTRAAGGQTLREIALWLDAQGVPTKTGKVWNELHISRILRNPVYKGQRRGEGTRSPVSEPVVPAALWRAAGEALAERNRRGRNSPRRRKALLSPFCGNPDCDASGQDLGPSPMYRLFFGRQGTYPYYRCSGRGPQRRGCGAKLIPTSELEEAVASAFLADYSYHYETRYVAGDGHEDEIDAVRQQLAAATDRLQANALWDRIEALEAEEATPGGWITEETAITKAEHFEALSRDEDALRSFLQKQTIYAWREPSGLLVVSIL